MSPGMDVEQLTFAAAANDLAKIRRAAADGVDLNGHGRKEGWTGLHWAAYQGHLPAVTLLLELGADPNIRGKIGDTALHVAVLRLGDDPAIVAALRNGGADGSIDNDYGMSPAAIARNKGGAIAQAFEKVG